ncbi:MAG: tRNA dihydrouridine synthase DusB [Eubacterium sp.]|nr:tRNA dihydrouridine synthase DusB [Candidatus Colimonas fimequi]
MVIGNLTFENPFFLAPLAGISDKSMRSLCMQQGASLTFTEMVSAKGLWYGDRKSRKLLELAPEEKSVGFQLFGREPEILAHAVKELNDCDNKVFDLNCGCPVPKVVKNGEGSALLKEPDRLGDVVEAMVKSTDKPVTVKIRMGFYRDTMIAEEIAKVAEAAGAAAITVHGRTREQYYEGKADWSAIAAVKKAVKIPVIGNGDIMSGADAIEMMNVTGSNGAMIARGALGNPWIFNECVRLWENSNEVEKPSQNDRIQMLLDHFELIKMDKGEAIAVREIRKHIGWYVKGMHGASVVKRRANTIASGEELREAVAPLLI